MHFYTAWECTYGTYVHRRMVSHRIYHESAIIPQSGKIGIRPLCIEPYNHSLKYNFNGYIKIDVYVVYFAACPL